MRAESILRRVLGHVEGEVHRARLNALKAAVVALISGGEIALSALGRAIGQRSHKHGIKRVDRLLGNERLAGEIDRIYAAVARYALRSMKRPVILLDWTKAGDRMCALTAAIPVQGRALPIYSVTCPGSQWTAPAIERRFLQTLATFLPPGCTPILVTDAGFRAPWIRKVQAIGWDFVTRIRGRTRVQRVGEPGWQRWNRLWHLARRAPRTLGSYRFVESHSVEAQLVVVHNRRRRRGRAKTVGRSMRALHGRRSAQEPWFLATSLTLPPKEIVAMYSLRMQIELTFRDLKSHRFGWGFEDARCGTTSRVSIQILVAALASFVTLLVGLAAEEAGLRKLYQANTITKRRVLSLVTLGRAVIRARHHLDLPVPHLSIVGIR